MRAATTDECAGRRLAEDVFKVGAGFECDVTGGQDLDRSVFESGLTVHFQSTAIQIQRERWQVPVQRASLSRGAMARSRPVRRVGYQPRRMRSARWFMSAIANGPFVRRTYRKRVRSISASTQSVFARASAARVWW